MEIIYSQLCLLYMQNGKINSKTMMARMQPRVIIMGCKCQGHLGTLSFCYFCKLYLQFHSKNKFREDLYILNIVYPVLRYCRQTTYGPCCLLSRIIILKKKFNILFLEPYCNVPFDLAPGVEYKIVLPIDMFRLRFQWDSISIKMC